MSKLRTMVPVKVTAVLPQSGSGQATQGAVAGAGYVQVQPMISMVDGGGNTTPHGTIYNIPYTRVYGGVNAVIMDPAVGDIGYMVVADRDISSWKSQVVGNQTQGGQGASSPTTQGSGAITPGSNRRFNMADGIYIGGVLNQTPKQFVTFQSGGITIQDINGNKIVMESGDVTITAPKIILNGTVYLGGASASKPVSIQGTVDTGGFADISSEATKAFAL